MLMDQGDLFRNSEQCFFFVGKNVCLFPCIQQQQSLRRFAIFQCIPGMHIDTECTTIYLGCLSPDTSSDLPELKCGPHLNDTFSSTILKLLFGLAPSGVFRAATVTNYAMRSYRTFSPLPITLQH